LAAPIASLPTEYPAALDMLVDQSILRIEIMKLFFPPRKCPRFVWVFRH
jgi:hypothetical protein